MTFKGVISRIAPWIGGLFFVALLAYLSFHYARITDFPIGDDPAIHIDTIKRLSYLDLLGQRYPLPLAIYKFIQQITGIEHSALFVNLISAYLLLAAISITIFVRQTFKSWPLAIGAALIFVTSRWVNDGLRMGLLADIFSWSIFFIALTFLARRHLIGTLIATGLLVLSHPFATLLYAILFIIYSACVFIQPSLKAERLFIAKTWLGYALLTGASYLLRPSIIQHFLEFKISDPAGWGDRTLKEILLDEDSRRFFIPFMAGLGLFGIVKEKSIAGTRIIIILLILALVFSLNYLFDISFIPFRFYVYLEMALAVLAGYGLLAILKNCNLSEGKMAVLVGSLALLIALPNVEVNQSIGHWQATRPEARAILLPEDRAAMIWLKNHTAPESTIMATRNRGIWIIALAERPAVLIDEAHYDNETVKLINPQYLYYPDRKNIPTDIASRYQPVFQQKSVSIWRANNENP